MEKTKMPEKLEKNIVICQNCLSKNTKKHGMQKKKFQSLQRFLCKSCKKTFTLQKQGKNKTYPIATTLNAISLYNLGHSQPEVLKLIPKKQRQTPQTPSQKTISNWLSEYKNLCSFHRLRKSALAISKNNPDEMIETHTFMHSNLPYKYQLHKAKLDLLKSELPEQKFQLLKNYLEKIPTKEFPHHIFKPKVCA